MLQGLLRRARTEERRAELREKLRLPPAPPGTSYIWDIFARLSFRRGSSGFGPMPISWVDLAAFGQVTGMRLKPGEVEMIEVLDHVYLASLSDNPSED